MKTVLSTVAFAIIVSTVAAQGQFNAAAFPPVNEVPPITSNEVKEWLKGLNFADVPTFPVHTGNPPQCPAITQIPPNQCWWTCQTCPADDIEVCPKPGDWGLTFDDGPTPQTTPLLQTLKANNVKATFFVMGSNVVRNAEILKQEVADGHHIASHTWSHHPLTTLSNEQIVAEIKWTEKAVMDITGLQMKTSDAYDSKDFNLNAAGTTEAQIGTALTKLATTLNTYAANPGTKGIITLQHDLYNVTIDFAKRLFPAIAQAKLKPLTIAQCLNDATPYQNSPSVAPPSTGSKGPNVKPNSTSALSVSSSVMMAALALLGTALATL
ncbi:chitin deacetylase [Modicella reniformis]|uniref:Chitin deacetylase n=1 Tax=Modicella reniformis TaxID=1440133 RepID=A0A9P6SPT9_9FUNG|nr:chitin deacetylase [Modicella reniformis]